MPNQRAALQPTWWQVFMDVLLHRRVRITAIIFLALIIEDLVTRVVPHNLFNIHDYQVLLGLAFIANGVGLRTWAAGTLKKRTHLATGGPYQLVRHPLYIGSFLMMLGFCFLVDDPENIWFVVGPILLLYVVRILHEEKHLAELFPDEWPAFAQSVPRFFPRRLPTNLFADWSTHQWMKNREYRLVGAAILGLIGIQLWHLIL